MAVNTENFNFDPDQLREKYRQERDKRLRADGNDQYKEVEGDFKYFHIYCLKNIIIWNR